MHIKKHYNNGLLKDIINQFIEIKKSSKKKRSLLPFDLIFILVSFSFPSVE